MVSPFFCFSNRNMRSFYDRGGKISDNKVQSVYYTNKIHIDDSAKAYRMVKRGIIDTSTNKFVVFPGRSLIN